MIDNYSNQLDQTPSFFKSLLDNEILNTNKDVPEDISELEGLFPFSFTNDHFVCKCCNQVPIIQVKSFNEINYECKKQRVNNTNIEKILNEFISINEINEDNKSSNLLCLAHKKPFKYYCCGCSINLCENCLKRSDIHCKHSLIIFDQLYYIFNKKIINIAEILMINGGNIAFEKENSNSNNNNDILSFEKENFNPNIENFIRLMSIIFNDFKNYQSYNLFQNILNIEYFLSNFIKNKKYKNELKESDIKIQEKIDKYADLKERIRTNNCQNIISVEISNIYNFNDINSLCQADLISLENLMLTYCGISDLSPLKEAKFKKIKKISFAVNNIDDKNIKIISELHFDELEELNLFQNKIKDFNFFHLKKNNKSYNNLETLYIGGNKFEYNTNSKSKYELSNIKNIGLSTGVFDKNTIFEIKNFDMKDLEKLFLSNNNLNDISFFNELELPNIKKITLNNNFIKNFNNLIKYKDTLEIIEIKNNNIDNINDLEEFVKNFKNLKSVEMSGNSINRNDNSLLEILENIRNRHIIIEI